MQQFDIFLLLGHLLFGGFFFWMGLQHFLLSDAMIGYAGAKGIPHSRLGVFFSGALIILGGLSLISGWYVAVGSVLIIAFLIPVTFMMHAFWKETDEASRAIEKVNFLKNIALLGGALIVLAHALA